MAALTACSSSDATQSIFQFSPPGQVAQLVEQRTENPRVGSSILPLATMYISDLRTNADPLATPMWGFCGDFMPRSVV